MKSDHRHELKTNELADWVAHFPDWARENRTNLIAVGAIVALVLVVYFVRFYRGNVASVRNQTRLTSLVAEVPQQIDRVANAAAQDRDESYVLLQSQKDLQDFADKSSDSDMAALALIERGAALRAELHYRLSEISHDDLVKQIDQAQASYQQALDRKPSSPALAATAQYGLGLCEEELGNFDKAGEIYREVAQKPEYAGTTAQASAAYRLKIMDDFKTDIVFRPAPPKPAQAPIPAGPVQPGTASAPTVTMVPAPATAGPVAPSEPKTEAAPAPTAAPQPATPASSPAPAAAPTKSDTNAPKGN
jgi:hypothetical protein